MGLWVLVSRGGVRVMSEGSSVAAALAAARVHPGLPGWLRLLPGGASPFAALSVAREAAGSFEGAVGRNN